MTRPVDAVREAPGLARLVCEGASGGRIVFGGGGDGVGVGRLIDAGVALYSPTARADAVGALMTNDRATVEVVLGAIAAGACLASFPLPGRNADIERYAALVTSACARHGIEEVVARDDVAELLQGLGVPTRPHTRLAARPLAVPTRFRLVQFSSGSTQAPKPVVLDDAALGANVQAILNALRPQPGDVAVSWLPLSHDMGLVGMLLTSVAAAAPRWVGHGDLVLLDPTDFLRRPSLWLDALSAHRGTFTAAPDFGYRMATQCPTTAGVDLSRLRCAIVGGEIVRADTLAGFTRGHGGSGLAPTALCPAYGLAELGVAATMTRPAHSWRVRDVDAAQLADGRLAPPPGGGAGVTLVASGEPLRGYEIECGDGGGIGPVAVRGPSIGVDGRTGHPFAGADGWLRTGDSGFLDGGWLYVCGRDDDILVVHGRNVYAPAIEAEVSKVDGVRAGRVTTVALASGDWLIVAEPAGAPGRTGVREEIRRAAVRVAGASPDEIVIVPRGSLPLTASGKLQRNEVRARLLSGRLGD